MAVTDKSVRGRQFYHLFLFFFFVTPFFTAFKKWLIHSFPAGLLKFDSLAGVRFLRTSSTSRLAHLGSRVAHSHGLERGGQASGDQGGG